MPSLKQMKNFVLKCLQESISITIDLEEDCDELLLCYCRPYSRWPRNVLLEAGISASLHPASEIQSQIPSRVGCEICCSLSHHLIYPLTARVAGATQMISPPVSFMIPYSPLPSRTWRTPGLSIPWCCLPTSSSVCLVFFPLSLCLGRWFWPDLMNGRHDHTTAVCVSLLWSAFFRVVRLPAGSWTGLPRW